MDFKTGGRSDGSVRRPGEAGFDYTDPIRSFLLTFPRVLFSPRAFFRDISGSRGIADPLIFAATCALIGAVLRGVFNTIARSIPGMQVLATQTGFVSAAASVFTYSMVGLLISTGVYHLLVMLLAGRNRAGLEATFRVVAYALAVQVLGWLPLLNIVAGLYGLYLCAFGFQAVHSTTYQRAAMVAALPLLLLLLGGLLFAVLALVLVTAG